MPPHTEPEPTELRDWLERADRPRRLGDWLFRKRSEENDSRLATMSQTRGLAQAALEDIDLDLDDPVQGDFGDYELLERLGNGGMGVVYRARQLSLDRDVALKVLAAGPWAGANFIERLRTEARHAARLAHPHIVSVFDVGQHDEFCYYTMRLVEGETLRERLNREHSLDRFEAVRITLSIADALAYAHGLGVLHLDIKPANILLDANGEPHLADFGLARNIEIGAAQTIAEISGTPHYMSPEQARPGSHPLTSGADIFALGATLFEMLVGRTPRDGITSRKDMRQLGSSRIPRLREIDKNADRELDAICARCLALDAGKRYSDAQALAADLRRWQLHHPIHAMPAGHIYRAGKFLRRNRIASALSGLIILIVLGAMIAMTWQVQQTKREAERTLQIKDQLIQLFLQPEDRQFGTSQKTVSEFLDQAAARLQSLPLGSEVRGELAGVLVGIYGQLGQSQSAATLAERELGGAPVTVETAARADLRLVTGWAVANYALSRADGLALPLASAIAHSEDVHSRIYFNALVTQSRIAIATGDFATAVRSGERALSVMQDGNLSTADSANLHMELAAAYVGVRQAKKGREHSEFALAQLGNEDSLTHIGATTMAGLRRALFGEFESAQVLFDDGAAQWKRLSLSYPANFQTITYAVNAFDMGDLDRSETMIEQGLVRSRVAYPTSVESTDWHWLPGEIALHRGDYPKAAARFAQGARLARQAERALAPIGVYLLALQSVALTRDGKLADAQRVLEIAQREAAALPHADFATSMTLAARAILLSHQKRHREALQTFDQALAEIEAGRKQPAVLEDQLRENRDALRYRVWKAQAQIDAGDLAGATATTRAARELGLATLGANHPFMQELSFVEKNSETRISPTILVHARSVRPQIESTKSCNWLLWVGAAR